MTDTLIMLFTSTLGGLGMFLLILVFSFKAAQVILKNRKGFQDEEVALLEFDDCQYNDEMDIPEGIDEGVDILFISTSENVMKLKTDNSIQEQSKAKVPNSGMQSLVLKKKRF